MKFTSGCSELVGAEEECGRGCRGVEKVTQCCGTQQSSERISEEWGRGYQSEGLELAIESRTANHAPSKYGTRSRRAGWPHRDAVLL